jgi:DNA-binding NtrC family response regulator
MDLARRLARAPGAPILIEGERGSGLPELARMIHDADPIARRGRFQMTAAHLVARPDMRGWSPNGTLFIEDIENLPVSAQGWVEELLACRSESDRPMRIVAGSRMGIGDLLRHPGLHEELVHALDVGRIMLTPLRNRKGDILGLARRFLAHYADWQGRPLLRFSRMAERKLLGHTYPANVRELRNVVERAAALATSDEVGEDDIVLFDQFEAKRAVIEPILAATTSRKHDASQVPTLAELERDYLVLLIREFRGRRTEISRALGVSYPTVSRMITKHRLDVKSIIDAGAAPIEVVD